MYPVYMLMLQAQVCGCISAHQGRHIKIRNGKLLMNENVSEIKFKQVEMGKF